MATRNRIKELRYVRAGDLLPDPRNWRIHGEAQTEALKTVLGRIGWTSAAAARETPEGLVLVDGHLRAGLDPDEKIPVLILDLDDSEAGEMLATFDPLAAMADVDLESLNSLLSDIDLSGLDDIEIEPMESLLADVRDFAGMDADGQPVETPSEAQSDVDGVYRVEMLPLAAVRPYEGHPRLIDDDAIATVAASIERYGFTEPITVDEHNVIVDGHTRFRAAQKLGMETIPALRTDMPPDQVREYRLAASRAAEMTGWDMQRLAAESENLTDTPPGWDNEEFEVLRGVDWNTPQQNNNRGGGIPQGDITLPDASEDFVTLTFNVPRAQYKKIKLACEAVISQHVPNN